MINYLGEINYQHFYLILAKYGLHLLKVLIILLIGLKLIKVFIKYLNNRLEISQIDPSLKSFLLPLISIILKFALFITIIAMLGIEMTSFIALIGSLGLTIGLALQGSLSNFAGGVLILLFKPFKVSDYIEVKGYSGTVKDITIFYTILATSDNNKVVIPNSALSNDSLINFSTYQTRRIELKISCNYKNDVYKIQDILISLFKGHELILQEPQPTVRLTGYTNNSINFTAYGWVESIDYSKVFNDLMFKVKDTFDENGVIVQN